VRAKRAAIFYLVASDESAILAVPASVGIISRFPQWREVITVSNIMALE